MGSRDTLIGVADNASSLAPGLTPFSRRHPVAIGAAFNIPVKEVYFRMLAYREHEGRLGVWDEEPEEDAIDSGRALEPFRSGSALRTPFGVYNTQLCNPATSLRGYLKTLPGPPTIAEL